MKQITISILLFFVAITNGFAQNEKDKHFEIDVMLGMHSYSSSFFHALNSVTLIDGVPGNSTEFSGYGTSMLPSLNFGYFFSNNIGIIAGFTAINVKNEIEMEDGTRVDYNSNSIDQYNVNVGIEGRINFEESPFSIHMGSGIIAAPYDISKNIESSSGSYYLSGNSTAFGYYGNSSFQIKIVSFLQFKTDLTYSFMPTKIVLKDSDGKVDRHLNNLNVGGITLKTGLTVQF